MEDSILSETRWPAPSLCGGSVDSRAVFLRAKFFFETRPGTVHVLCEHFRGSTNQHAIPNRRTSAKEKEILLMWCTTIWRTTGTGGPPSKTLCALPAKLGQIIYTSLPKKLAAWQSFALGKATPP